tara:strand:+ start:327 stop:566 length:240 start_codon:yes stop_codon:yes gene_type:complete
MSRICKITGKRPRVGNNVSKANNKTKRRQYPNLQNKKVFIPETGRTVRLKLSTKGIKTLDKIGLQSFLNKNNLKLSDIM